MGAIDRCNRAHDLEDKGWKWDRDSDILTPPADILERIPKEFKFPDDLYKAEQLQQVTEKDEEDE